MRVGFGKHKDLTTEQLILKQPDYVRWLVDNTSFTGKASQLRKEILTHLLPAFDAKPIVQRCHGCKAAGVYATGYIGNASLMYWWCNSCDPYGAGANPGKLTTIKTYEDALSFAQECGGRQSDYQTAVRTFAKGKGAPSRITEQAAAKFFSQ